MINAKERTLEPLELAVIEKLLAGDHPALVGLRQQLPFLSVKSRRPTGVGFFTEFTVAPGAVPISTPKPKIRFGDVEATMDGLNHGAGFLLSVNNGFLHRLEGYSYDEPWPASVAGIKLHYPDPMRKSVVESFG